MRQKKYLKIIYITFLILVGLSTARKIYAYSATMPNVSLGNNSSGPFEWPRYETNEYNGGTNKRFYCTYNDKLIKLRTININAYDDQGRTIIPFSYISLVDFKAGTSIGMNVQEYKSASWNISGRKIYEHLTLKRCEYTYKPPECPMCALLAQCQAAAQAIAQAQAAAQAGNPGALAGLGNFGNLSGCTPNLAQECYECQHQCDGNDQTKYLYGYGPYYANSTAIIDACLPSKGKVKDWQDETGDKETAWLECCPKVIDKCHNEGTPAGSLAQSIFPLRRVEGENGMQEDDITNMCTTLAAADTSDKRAIPFVATPTIEVQILEANDYNKESLKLKRFSGYKVLIDEELYKNDPRPTLSIAHYVKKDESDKNFYHLETFYDNEKKNIKTIEDPEQKKTKLPDVDYVPQKEDGYYVSYEYSPDKVCINVKTGNVYYDVDNEAECSNKKNDKNVKEVPNEITEDTYLDQKEVEYWHYFIPLDTTTTSCDSNDVGFFISVTDKKTNPMESDYCASILRHLAIQSTNILNYADILLPIKGDTTYGFKGDFTGEKMPQYANDKKNEYGDDYNMFNNLGYECLFSIKTRFNVKQKFYGEITEDGQLKIRGYGFYYRPIDVTKPFPNSLASDSLWNGIYNATTNTISVRGKTTKLDESFDNITYSTKDISSDPATLQSVRINTVNGEKYTSFKDIDSKTGQSEFVRNYNLRKNVDLSAIYKLGCGPDNMDWEEGECNK